MCNNKSMKIPSDHSGPKPAGRDDLDKVTAASVNASRSMGIRDWPEAIKRWQAILDEFGDEAPANTWIGLSNALRRSQKYARSEEIAVRGIKKHPNSLGLKIERAEIAVARGDWPEAIKRWQAILDKVTDKSRLATVYAHLPASYVRTGEYQKADAVIREGLNYHPENLPIWKAYAEIPMARGDWPEAIKRWQAILDEFGDEAPALSWAGLVSSLRKSSKLNDAHQKLKEALAKHPGDLELQIEYAELANAQGDWPEAIKRWQAILDNPSAKAQMSIAKNLYIRFNVSILKRLVNIADYKVWIKKYSSSKTRRKIAIYTSFTGDYDSLKLPEIIDDRFDYIVYTDEPVDGMGVYDVRPLNQPYFKDDGSRATRYPKTHPHILLKEYDIAIWTDTSLMIAGDLMPVIDAFFKSGEAIGNATHPNRQSLDEEIEACIDLDKDDPVLLKKQLDYYKSIDFNTNDLANNGVLMFNLSHRKLASVMETWWDQICRYSKRDQLSFNYSLFKNKAERYHLTRPPEDIRNHPAFIFVPHHTESELLNKLYSLLKVR
jgi:tetratricopeptide (TPR) repeat protein